ncbi:DUF4837 family protein [Flavobacterium sp. CS20]|uniref:DUF4837 family protein n=1 Tax=Flavobacterium sp. CS20 TaxID=2775246 RepID=UPI001B3A6BC9|nr:DUF4837 family protein [Flavobacterium sp. CS20]QTY26090.1 DUF4837 family protein [Flavobacterium sp. CS20]
MKRLLFLMVLSLMACDNGKGVYIADSSGNLNLVNIVSENQLWDGQLGEEIRNVMAKDAEGLPQKEPLYKLRHIPTNAFTGFAKKNRTFLKFELAKQNNITFVKDSFARPQLGVFIKGKNKNELVDIFKNNQEKILNSINKTEIEEKWRRINKSLDKDTEIQKSLGVSIKFPTAYRYAKESNDDFVWLRKEIDRGSMEIFIYQIPISRIENDNSVISNIVKIRDSIGKANVPGPRPDTYMITEEAYMPYLYETKIDGKFAYETRGTWVVKGAFMGGPFLNYAIRDEANDRFVVIEGIVYKPTAEKRNNIFEIEAIAKSLKF